MLDAAPTPAWFPPPWVEREAVGAYVIPVMMQRCSQSGGPSRPPHEYLITAALLPVSSHCWRPDPGSACQAASAALPLNLVSAHVEELWVGWGGFLAQTPQVCWFEPIPPPEQQVLVHDPWSRF